MRLYFFVTRDLFILPPNGDVGRDEFGDVGRDEFGDGGRDAYDSNDELFE
jgi:hypothetical protein